MSKKKQEELIQALKDYQKNNPPSADDLREHAISWVVGESNLGGRTPMSRKEAGEMYDQLQLKKEKQNET